MNLSAGVAKTLQLKKISLIVGFTYRGLTVYQNGYDEPVQLRVLIEFKLQLFLIT